MSWGEPKALRPFADTSPFFGLPLPDDVRVTAQVMAQPDPELSERVIAALADGTPLVTRKRVGAGQIVLFHVTANAEWSTLPLSGLFVQMLDRLAVSSRAESRSAEAAEAADGEGAPLDIDDAVDDGTRAVIAEFVFDTERVARRERVERGKIAGQRGRAGATEAGVHDRAERQGPIGVLDAVADVASPTSLVQPGHELGTVEARPVAVRRRAERRIENERLGQHGGQVTV